MSQQPNSQVREIKELCNVFQTKVHNIETKIRIDILISLLKHELNGNSNPDHIHVLKLLDDDNKRRLSSKL